MVVWFVQHPQSIRRDMRRQMLVLNNQSTPMRAASAVLPGEEVRRQAGSAEQAIAENEPLQRR